MKKVLIIANYKGSIGGISGQVEVLRDMLNHESTQSGERKVESGKYRADIFSTQGNVVRRVLKFIRLICVVPHYDVLHIHGCSEWGMLSIVYGVIAGKIWRKRIIVTYHGGGAEDYFTKHGAFARRWLNRADKVIVLNGYLEKVFKDHDIPCVVIPNCITLSEAQEHSAYQWNAPRFISVRHLRELYNIPCILKAFEKVYEQIPGATLTILGSGPQLEELQEWVKKKVESGKLKAESVRFVGQVANSEMPKYLAESDMMLSAPRIDNMPVSVLEAMNAGVLVISSNVGGVPYMIEYGRTGLLFNSTKTEINTVPAINIDKGEVTKNAHSTSVSSSSPHGLECNQPQVLTSELAAPVIANTPNMPTDESHVECLQKNVDCINLEKNEKNNAVDALAEQMMWAVEHQEESVKMIKAAHEEVKKYSWDNIRKRLLLLYE